MLPALNPPSDDHFAVPSKRHFIEDVVYELSKRILKSSAQDCPVLRAKSEPKLLPATDNLYSALGCLVYKKCSGLIIAMEEPEQDHADYEVLGAVNDFSDELVVFAYERQLDCDPQNSAHYLDCLRRIAACRNSIVLQERSIVAGWA